MVTTREADVLDTRETPRTEALRVLEHEIAVLLGRVRRVVAERAALVHPELGSTGYSVLGALQESGPLRATDLAAMFSLDKGALSRIIHHLLELGLVERRPDPADGRASLVQLTHHGRERMQAVTEQRRELFAAKLADWGADELDDLAARLARYNAALERRLHS